MLGRLIAFDTVSANSNMDMINFMSEFLASHEIKCDISPNDDGTKADMIATLGPLVEGGIVLSGHTDVVPVDGQNWDSDPFKLDQRESSYC